MNLQNNISFSELLDILDNQLTNSFKPRVDAIPNVQSKGIYFWFMKKIAYELLMKGHSDEEIKEILLNDNTHLIEQN
jgi:hypothetical protein